MKHQLFAGNFLSALLQGLNIAQYQSIFKLKFMHCFFLVQFCHLLFFNLYSDRFVFFLMLTPVCRVCLLDLHQICLSVIKREEFTRRTNMAYSCCQVSIKSVWLQESCRSWLRLSSQKEGERGREKCPLCCGLFVIN